MGAIAVGEARYGGFFERLIAYIVDAIIISVVASVLYSPGFLTESGALDALSGLLGFVWTVGYPIYFWANTGQTIGKKLLGLKVVGPDGGTGGIGYGPAVMRLIGYFVSGFVFYLGFLWIIWDSTKQGWHDKIANTHVIKV